jgi:hypothetical protein
MIAATRGRFVEANQSSLFAGGVVEKYDGKQVPKLALAANDHISGR